MPMDDVVAKRGKTQEDDYFRRMEQELIERMRHAAAEAAAHQGLSAETGLDDPEMLRELSALGFAADTVSLLPFLPLVQVAWAEGGVTEAERQMINTLARTRGIVEGGAADRQLAGWLNTRPDDQLFARATRLVAAVLRTQGSESGALDVDDLVQYCETIAGASGGVFGIKKISTDERALIARLAADLRKRHA